MGRGRKYRRRCLKRQQKTAAEGTTKQESRPTKKSRKREKRRVQVLKIAEDKTYLEKYGKGPHFFGTFTFDQESDGEVA